MSDAPWQEFEGEAEGAAEDSAKTRAIELHKIVDELMALHRFKRDDAGNLYIYTGAFWRELSSARLERLIYEIKPAVSSHRRNEISKLLGVRSHDLEFAWGQVRETEVAFADCVVDVMTGEAREHDPEDMLESVLPWRYDGRARAPRWSAVLLQYFEDPEDGRHDLLQEFFGYICLNHSRYKRALMLLGPGDTGKSVIVNLARLMVGTEATAQLSLEHMDDPGARYAIKGKRLNLATEVSQRALMAESGFKAMVSGDPVGLERKFKDPEMYMPTAKHVIAANDLPRIYGRALEVFERFLILPLTRVFTRADQDPHLLDALEAEIPGVINWALEGARRLIGNRGLFTEARAASSALAEADARRNPMVDFVAEQMVAREGEFLTLAAIAQRMNETRKQPVTSRQVGAWLREVRLEVRKKKTKDGRTLPCLMGFKWAGMDAAGVLPSDFHKPNDEAD